MKITKNEDGTVTVSVPQAPESYDPEIGALFVSETLTAAEFSKASSPSPAAAPKKRAKKPAAKKPEATTPAATPHSPFSGHSPFDK